MAQSGSAPVLGTGGREFESLYSDHKLKNCLRFIRGYFAPRELKTPLGHPRIGQAKRHWVVLGGGEAVAATSATDSAGHTMHTADTLGTHSTRKAAPVLGLRW